MELPSRAFKAVDGGTLLVCRVKPGASKSGIAGAYGEDCVKITLASPPVDGKANQALCRLIAELCGVPKGRVEIASGHASRSKALRIAGIPPGELRALLSEEMK